MDKLEYIPGDLAFHYIPKTIIKKYVKVYVCSTQNALSLEDMDGNLYDYIGELYPIPLTPEILEKNGWVKKVRRVIWEECGAYIHIVSETIVAVCDGKFFPCVFKDSEDILANDWEEVKG